MKNLTETSKLKLENLIIQSFITNLENYDSKRIIGVVAFFSKCISTEGICK